MLQISLISAGYSVTPRGSPVSGSKLRKRREGLTGTKWFHQPPHLASSGWEIPPHSLRASFLPFLFAHSPTLASCILGYPDLSSGSAQLCNPRLFCGRCTIGPPRRQQEASGAFTQFCLGLFYVKRHNAGFLELFILIETYLLFGV